MTVTESKRYHMMLARIFSVLFVFSALVWFVNEAIANDASCEATNSAAFFLTPGNFRILVQLGMFVFGLGVFVQQSRANKKEVERQGQIIEVYIRETRDSQREQTDKMDGRFREVYQKLDRLTEQIYNSINKNTHGISEVEKAVTFLKSRCDERSKRRDHNGD